MTLIDAMLSGKPFKRREHIYWREVVGDEGIITFENSVSTPSLVYDDIIADDWEIKDGLA